MSKHAKVALGLFVAAFALTRVQRFVVPRLEADVALQLTAMILLSGAALLGFSFVGVCFYYRLRPRPRNDTASGGGDPVQTGTEAGPVHGWQWGLLLLLSLAYATEPAATFIGLASALAGG